MVNVKVIKAKNAIISFGIIAFLLMSFIKIIVVGKNKIKEVSLVPLIEDTIILANGNSLKEFKSMDRDNTEKILASELQMSKYIKEKEIPKEVPENNEVEIAKEEEKIEEAKTGIGTEIISGGNINNKYTNEYNGVQIKNESKYELTEDMLTPNINLENKKDIIIYHTHTCESYTQSAGFEYTPSGNFRTTDLNFSVVRVGRELKNRLTNYGFNVVHNETYHDYPAYSGSYNRSLTSVKNELVANPNTQMVIDLHRDAVGEGGKYAPTVKIGDDYVAQIMFVIGTDGGGLTHKDWVQNLKFAIKIVQKGNELYPGLFKPIMVRNSRYNQHVAKAATIMEIGATGNTMEQCLNSMKYLSKVMDEALNKN
ncbi:MAG: stage II sporulation protein P [Clostridia bacterium]|jgi:stage II sporulation protein P